MNCVAPVSFSTLQSVQLRTREQALESFLFFSNSVMSLNLASDVCGAAQDVVEDKEDAVVHTGRPKILLLALHTWLYVQGYTVVSSISPERNEVTQWLDLEPLEEKKISVALNLLERGVEVRWL